MLNRLVQQSLAAALEQLPAGRPLRVLEIGAGTGGTTGYVLYHVLPVERTEYEFTPTSRPKFLRGGRRAIFGVCMLSSIRGWTSRIRRCSQRFTAHQFDVVLAANVVHATWDIEATMAHVTRVACAESLLLQLLEGLQRQAWLDLTLGRLDGWWRFEDADRDDYALLDFDSWWRLLRSQGSAEPVGHQRRPTCTSRRC